MYLCHIKVWHGNAHETFKMCTKWITFGPSSYRRCLLRPRFGFPSRYSVLLYRLLRLWPFYFRDIILWPIFSWLISYFVCWQGFLQQMENKFESMNTMADPTPAHRGHPTSRLLIYLYFLLFIFLFFWFIFWFWKFHVTNFQLSS